jgi:hypothetical protein
MALADALFAADAALDVDDSVVLLSVVDVGIDLPPPLLPHAIMQSAVVMSAMFRIIFSPLGSIFEVPPTYMVGGTAYHTLDETDMSKFQRKFLFCCEF